MNRRNIIIVVSILSFVFIIGGISYSYFVYNKDIGNVNLNTGEISINLSGINGNKSFINVTPVSDIDGKTSSDYFDFTVDATVDTERIYYEVYLMPDDNNTLDTNYLKTYLTDQNNVEIKGVTIFDDLGNSEVENGKVIYKGIIEVNQNGASKNESKNFRLRIWLDENYQDQTSKTFTFDIYLYAKNVDSDFVLPYGTNLVRSSIIAKQNASINSCNPIWIDNMDTPNDSSDDITYFSGTNECVDMNYVWYSGKLWRITAIYPNGSMKLITENNITTISYNSSSNIFYTDVNNSSFMYQWLNEDFYDTLYNIRSFVDLGKKWNSTMPADTNISTKPEETIMITASVGLLNNYEYYNSYRCAGSNNCDGDNYSEGYLNNKYYWWLLNPYSASNIWGVFDNGKYNSGPPLYAFGVRPSIYLKSGLEFVGSGTKQSPYKIVGDKRNGSSNDLINTRLSGEYIKLKSGSNEQLFRIVGIEDNKTKIISVNYVDNKTKRPLTAENQSGNGIVYYGSEPISSGDNTWYKYLTETFYPNLVSTYGNLFDNGLYYMGEISVGNSYKLGICASNNGNTKSCSKTNQAGVFNVGLPRFGEMFSTQPVDFSNSEGMWLINPTSGRVGWLVLTQGMGYYNDISVSSWAACPTLHLKSTVKIIEGSGTESDPYVVGL